MPKMGSTMMARKKQRRSQNMTVTAATISQISQLIDERCKKVKVKADIALHGNPISELRDVTCHIGSHSVTCQPTQVNASRLNPSHAGWYSIYRPRRDGRLSLPI